MAYGDHTTAFKLLAKNATEDQIRASGDFQRYPGELGTVTFSDKSFIELRRFDNHQAFLSSGWNVTPRKGGANASMGL